MALSQKHSGKILNPWFNRQEWEFVYNKIFKENVQDYNVAHEILQIWKARTPHLFAGVEGTLIIINALVQQYTPENEYNIQVVYSAALMRFLNIICATDQKQVTIFQTAKKKNIPDWIIHMRHEFAHGQNLASYDLLKFALNCCLQWLKNEYWDQELKTMSDFFEEETVQESNTDFENVLNNYIQTVKIVAKRKLLPKKIICIGEFSIPEQNEIIDAGRRGVVLTGDIQIDDYLDSYENSVLELVSSSNLDEFVNNFADAIVNSIIDIENRIELVYNGENENGTEVEIKKFKKIVTHYLISIRSMIRKFHNNGIIHKLVDKLVLKTFMPFSTESKIASLYLNEIFNCIYYSTLKLNKLSKNKDNSQKEKFFDYIKFNIKSDAELIKYDLVNFRNKVLYNPTKNTYLFIYPLLRLSGYNNEAASDQLTLITQMFGDDDKLPYNPPDDKTYDYMDLMKLIPDNVRDSIKESIEKNVSNDIVSLDDFSNGIIKNFEIPEDKVTKTASNRVKCVRVRDPFMFQGCPIGVLPGQSSERNPLLKFLDTDDL